MLRVYNFFQSDLRHIFSNEFSEDLPPTTQLILAYLPEFDPS